MSRTAPTSSVSFGTAKGERLFRWACVATVFLGALLLFEVQPLISKAILPWFGGTPAVWTTCMLFFQCLLLAGYAVAHFVSRRKHAKIELAVLLVIAAIGVSTLPILPRDTWKPTAGAEPTAWILALLAATIGPAYLLLATTSPLAQVWWNRATAGQSPYRLYALSNAGSLLALLSYPFIVERYLGVAQQAFWWSILFTLFVLMFLTSQIMAWRLAGGAELAESNQGPESDSAAGRQERRGKNRRQRQTHPHASAASKKASKRRQKASDGETIGAILLNVLASDRLLWLALSCCGSVLLLATTNAICQDIAVVPLLWIAPLSLYLLSFIVAFDSPRWYRRGLFVGVALVTLAVLLGSLYFKSELVGFLAGNVLSDIVPIKANVFSHLVFVHIAFFAACMVCHGELARLRPPASELTGYYLHVATGGAVGGILVGVMAPMVLSDYYELPLGVVFFWLLLLIVLFRDPESWLYYRRSPRICFAASCTFVMAAILGMAYQSARPLDTFDVRRNFYGVLKLSEKADQGKPQTRRYELVHGTILHGLQFRDPDRRRHPTSYYGPASGVGLAMNYTEEVPNRRVGLVGLGAGTLAAYGRPGDTFVFYEINPEVVALTKKYFTYLNDSRAECDIVLGDARLSLERQLKEKKRQGFDLLILDAFSSDSIPVHLLTKEAFDCYLPHVKPSGVIAVHISNRYLDLEPVVLAIAERFSLHVVDVDSPGEDADEISAAHWILLSHDQAIETLLSEPNTAPPSGKPLQRIWTDDWSNIFEVIGS